MTIRDEVSKEIQGHKDVITMNVFRFNGLEIDINEELNEEDLEIKLAEYVKTRYKFFKINNRENDKANIFLLEVGVADINNFTIVDPSDLTPFENMSVQMVIAEVMEQEGFIKAESETESDYNIDELYEEVSQSDAKIIEAGDDKIIEEYKKSGDGCCSSSCCGGGE